MSILDLKLRYIKCNTTDILSLRQNLQNTSLFQDIFLDLKLRK